MLFVLDFRFPYDTDIDFTIGASKQSRVQAIYSSRFRYKLSEKREEIFDNRATEPAHERSLVEADEVVVTIRGLESTLTPEYLFSGIYTIFPPRNSGRFLYHPLHIPSSLSSCPAS